MRLANRMPYTSGTKAMASVQILKVQHVLALEASDSQHSWQDCRLDISKCSPDQLEMLQGFREELHDAISKLKQKKDWESTTRYHFYSLLRSEQGTEGKCECTDLGKNCMSLLVKKRTEQKQKRTGVFALTPQVMELLDLAFPSSPRVNNKSIAEEVGGWFFDKRGEGTSKCASIYATRRTNTWFLISHSRDEAIILFLPFLSFRRGIVKFASEGDTHPKRC